MELPQAPDWCPHCGARVPQRASWCSLCLTPVPRPAMPSVAPPTPPDPPAAPRPVADAAGSRAEAMLVELAVTDRLGGLGDGVTGVVLRLGKMTRFALAFALAVAVALVAVAATALIGALPGGG